MLIGTPPTYVIFETRNRDQEQQHGGRTERSSQIKLNVNHNIASVFDMYFPIGWPKYFSSKDVHCGELKSLRYNRDRSLLAVVSDHSVCIWNNRVSIDYI